MGRPRFRQLPHTADVRLAVWGDTASELLSNAVAGAVRLALGASPGGAVEHWRGVRPWPRALDEQLVRVVNEALFLLYVRREITLTVRLRGSDASLGTRPLPAGRRPETEIKAATFHALRPATTGRRGIVLTLDL